MIHRGPATSAFLGLLLVLGAGCGSSGDSDSGATPPTSAATTAPSHAADTTVPASSGGPAAGTSVPPRDDGDPAAAEPIVLPGLTAVLEQYREDEILNLLQVKATNGSASSVDVLDLRLDWAGVTGNEPLARGVLVSPGQRVDIPINAGRAACSDPPGADEQPPSAPVAAIGRASIDGGPPVLISIPVTDPGKILAKIFPLSCRDQRVQWAASLSFGTTWTPTTTDEGAPAVAGTVEMRRNHSTEPIRLLHLNGSVLLRLVDPTPSDPVAVLGAGQDSLSVPILVVQSGRCEAHALAESKKTYLIVMDVAIGDEPSIGAEVVFDIPSRQVLGKMINESCGVG